MHPWHEQKALSTIIKQSNHTFEFAFGIIYRTNYQKSLTFRHQTATMKAMMATSFDVSAVCFHAPPSHSPFLRLLSPNRHHTRSSSLKTLNSYKGSSNITVEPNFPNFRMGAALNGNLEAIGVPTSVPVRVAHELLLAGHKYLDVRTPEEFNAGHVPDAVNIPYMFRVGSGMTKNPNFLKEVSAHFRKDAEIIVGCQLGKRSMMAASDLLAAGFTGVTDIAGGYAAWTQNGLPTGM